MFWLEFKKNCLRKGSSFDSITYLVQNVIREATRDKTQK